jgi:adenosine kinase
MPKKLTPRSFNLKAPKILVSGSIVFDTIFELTSAIGDQIVIEQNTAGKQNLMFTAGEKEVYFGGTAGNIAYGLGLLKESSFVLSVTGKDSLDYKAFIKKNGGVFKGIEDKDGYTANFIGITDTKKEQIGIFQGGTYSKNVNKLKVSKYLSQKELKSIECAIFSVGTAKSISSQIQEFRKINNDAFTIFDPGQMLMIDFTPEYIVKSLKNSDIAIFNETEFAHVKRHFGLELEDIFKLGVTYVIETKGADGSVLYELENDAIRETSVPTPKIKKVLDPTGAGDAYRAGIMYGIVNDLDIKESMKLASKMGAECVKHRGGQTYKIK